MSPHKIQRIASWTLVAAVEIEIRLLETDLLLLSLAVAPYEIYETILIKVGNSPRIFCI